METALKSHPYFEGQFERDTSVILKNSDLENMIKLLEEKSRNYTGVDFNRVNTFGLKRIQIIYKNFILNLMSMGARLAEGETLKLRRHVAENLLRFSIH